MYGLVLQNAKSMDGVAVFEKLEQLEEAAKKLKTLLPKIYSGKEIALDKVLDESVGFELRDRFTLPMAGCFQFLQFDDNLRVVNRIVKLEKVLFVDEKGKQTLVDCE